MASTYTAKRIVREYSSLSEKEKHDVLLQLLRNTEISQLQKLFPKMKELLSFDLVTQLPVELSQAVFSFLDVASLCAASQCCHRWREIGNTDSLWYKLCQNKGYTKYEHLVQPEWTGRNHPTYQSITIPHKKTLLQLPLWKLVYWKAHHLNKHWNLGVYKVAPLLRGHRLPVTSISLEDDLLVSGSGDNTARVWSLQTLECLHVLENHTDTVNCIIIKDGLIATGSSDSLVRVFDSRTGQCIRSMHGHTSSVDHIQFNGRTIVSGGSDWISPNSSVRVWDVHTGKLLHTLTGHTEELECLLLCKNMALSGSWDRTLRVWDILTGVCKLILQDHTEVVYCCGYNGTRIVTGGGDNVLKVWDDEHGHCIATLVGHTQEVVCVHCEVELIASGSSDSSVRIWNYAGFCLHVLEEHIGVVRCVHLHGNRLVSGGDRKKIIVWNAETGKKLHAVHRQQSLLHKICVTDTLIVTASPDSPGTVSIISYW